MKASPKTLVVLSPGFARDENDSTCLPLQQSFLINLQQSKPELKIIILAFQYPYHRDKYKWHGIDVIPFNGRNKGGISRLLLRGKIKRVLNAISIEYQIAGLLSFWYGECAVVGQRFSDKHQLPHYCWIWGQDARKENKYPQRYSLPGKNLLCFSDFLQDEFERNHSVRPYHVIPPGIDKKEFSDVLPVKDIHIMGAGSLIPLKRYEIFIRIIAEIKKTIPGLKAVIAGEGPERKKLEKLISQNQLGDTITMLGELPHDQVLRWMERSRVFLHPSEYEGFGVVHIEALYAGAKVISFVKPMNKPIENWVLAGNEEEMISKSIQLLDKTDHTRVIPFTIESTVKKMEALFSL